MLKIVVYVTLGEYLLFQEDNNILVLPSVVQMCYKMLFRNLEICRKETKELFNCFARIPRRVESL